MNIEKKQSEKQFLALCVICTVQFITPFLASGINIALPAIGRYYQATTFQLSLVSMLYLLGLGMMLLPSGQLADLFGRKKIFFLGLLFYILSSLLITFSPSMEIFLGLRVVQGLSLALISTASFAILSSIVPAERRGKSMGIVIAFTYAGLSAGPVLGGVLVSSINWKAIFYLASVLGILCLALGKKALQGEWWGDRKQKFDVVGSLFFALALALLTMGITGKEWLGSLTRVFLLASVVVAVLFIVFERKAASPVLPVGILRTNRPFSLSILAALLNYAASYNIIFYFSLYLQSVRGFSAQEAGLFLMVQTLIQCVLSPWAGKLADRIYPGKLATIGMGLCGVALLLAGRIDANSSLIFILAIFVVMGIGFALFSPPNTTLIMNSVPQFLYGMASSLSAIARSLGMLAGMGISTWLIEYFMGHSVINAETQQAFMSTMHRGMVVFAVICFLGIFCSMGRMQKGK